MLWTSSSTHFNSLEHPLPCGLRTFCSLILICINLYAYLFTLLHSVLLHYSEIQLVFFYFKLHNNATVQMSKIIIDK